MPRPSCRHPGSLQQPNWARARAWGADRDGDVDEPFGVYNALRCHKEVAKHPKSKWQGCFLLHWTIFSTILEKEGGCSLSCIFYLNGCLLPAS